MSEIRPYKIYPIDLSVANTVGYPITGQYPLCRVLNAFLAGALYSDVQIEVQPDESDPFTLGLGQSALIEGVRRWRLRWDAQPGVTIEIAFSSDAKQNDWDMDPPTQLVTTGTTPLSVALPLAGLDADTVAERTFAARMTIGKQAARYCYLGLWNPAASGVNVFVTDFGIGRPDAVGAVRVGLMNVALADGALTALEKTYTGAAPAAEWRYERAVAPVTFLQVQAAGSPISMAPFFTGLAARPILLAPGYGIAAYANDVNLDIEVSAEWIERAV